MTREAPIVRQIQLAVSAFGKSRAFRNTVAVATLGKPQRIQRDGAVFLHEGDVVVKKGRIAQIGMPEGSADLCGWREVTITADMVGRSFAQFLSIEVKKPKDSRTSEAQHNWRKITAEAGACSGIVKSIAEAEALLRSKI